MNLIKNIFSRKSNIPNSSNKLDISRYMRLGVDRALSPSLGYLLYETSGPLGDAVDMISGKFAQMKPVVLNADGNEVVKGSKEVLDLLKNPNFRDTYTQFATNLATNFLLNGNAYIEAQGFFKSKPSEIFVLPNTSVNISEGSNEATYIVTITGLFHFLMDNFKLTPESGRILNSNGLLELLHIRRFDQSTGSLFAVSKVQSIIRDVSVVKQALVHEESSLKRGLSATGIISVDTDDSDSFEQFKNDLINHNTGAGNAGRQISTMGKTVSWAKMDQNNRDMQLLQNKQDSRQSIYDRLDIPEALRNSSVQTYNNYQTALYALYDNAVIPLANILFESLTNMFIDRGMLKNGERITFDVKEISALQLKRNEELKVLSDVQVLSVNELRTQAGYEEVPGGDVILVNSSLVPVATDSFTDDNLEEPRRKEFGAKWEKLGANEKEIDDYWTEYKKITGSE